MMASQQCGSKRVVGLCSENSSRSLFLLPNEFNLQQASGGISFARLC